MLSPMAASALTQPVWPVSGWPCGVPVWGFQSRMVPSSPAEARSGSPVLVAMTASARTGPE